MRIKWRNPKMGRTQKVLRISTWVLGIMVIVPYLVFSMSYPHVVMECSFLTGLCPLRKDTTYDIAITSFHISYYAWWILAPTALLTGFADMTISLVKQVRNV